MFCCILLRLLCCTRRETGIWSAADALAWPGRCLQQVPAAEQVCLWEEMRTAWPQATNKLHLKCLVTRMTPMRRSQSSSEETSTAPTPMPHKNDLIVWLRMQPQQRRIYEVLLGTPSSPSDHGSENVEILAACSTLPARRRCKAGTWGVATTVGHNVLGKAAITSVLRQAPLKEWQMVLEEGHSKGLELESPLTCRSSWRKGRWSSNKQY